MTSPSSVWYVYGVVPSSLDVSRAPSGLDDAALALGREGDLAALMSALKGSDYEPAHVERATEEVEWLAPRAVAHDQVLTWASDRGPVVPLPMLSLFSSEDAVREMLRERAPQLRSALRRAAEGREYVLRVYRVDTELSAVAAELSPELATLERAASSASPGQRYLLERKLEAARKSELRVIGRRVARDVFESLAPLAVDRGARESDPRSAGAATAVAADAREQPLVLDAAFLVAEGGLERFRGALTTLLDRHEGRGFRFEFTGPWPPYHFVHDLGEATSRGA